jgi:hypothetical protein
MPRLARFGAAPRFRVCLQYLLVSHRSYAPGQRLSIFHVAAEELSGWLFGIPIAIQITDRLCVAAEAGQSGAAGVRQDSANTGGIFQ